MNWTAVRAIARKDIASVLRNRGVLLPLVITPIVVLVLLPVILVGGAEPIMRGGELPVDGAGPFQELSEQAAEADQPGAPQTPHGRWTVFVLEVFLAPLFLLVPLVTATVIAADSFAGERERGTLEALLHTPTRDHELLAGKFLAAWVPAVTVSTAGFVVYAFVANALAWGSLGRVFFPTPMWLVLALFVAPGIAALGLGLMVIASSRVNSLQAAHQIGSLLVLPIVMLLVAQIAGLLRFEVGLVTIMGLGIWLAEIAALLIGSGSLRRQRLALKL